MHISLGSDLKNRGTDLDVGKEGGAVVLDLFGVASELRVESENGPKVIPAFEHHMGPPLFRDGFRRMYQLVPTGPGVSEHMKDDAGEPVEVERSWCFVAKFDRAGKDGSVIERTATIVLTCFPGGGEDDEEEDADAWALEIDIAGVVFAADLPDFEDKPIPSAQLLPPYAAGRMRIK